MLLDMIGEEICNIVRKKFRVFIIMFIVKIDEKSIILGLYIGVDDYIIKFFSLREFIVRIYVIFRRLNEEVVFLFNEILFNDNDLVIDMLKKEIWKNGENIVFILR